MNRLVNRVTLKDVAKVSGVVESTVSRALSNQGEISKTTRIKVLKVANELGYKSTFKKFSNLTSYSEGKRGIVGVVVEALNNSFFPYLVDILHDELDSLGFDMILIIDEIPRGQAGKKLKRLVDTLEGVIVTTATVGSETVAFLKERNIPTVLAIRSNLQGNVHVAESDNYMSGKVALEHLLSLGHKRIGCLMGPIKTSTTISRLKGAKAALEAVNVPFDDKLLFHTDYTHEGGYSSCVQILRKCNPPTALFCANDVIAIGAMDAAQKMGFNIPKDLSIIGMDDIPMASWGMISLTTIRQPLEEIGSLVARQISELINSKNKAPPKNYIFPTSLVVRSTTGFVNNQTISNKQNTTFRREQVL